MKIPRFANAIGYIGDDLVVSAAAESKKKTRRISWFKWGAVAACLTVLVIACTALPSLFSSNAETENRYKNVQIRTGEFMVEWPWEYKTVYEKYTDLTLNGAEYKNKGRAVSEALIGDLIGTYTVAGYDNIAAEKYTENFEVYKLKYADDSRFVAVKMDGDYYTFKKNVYDPPNTLGKLFALIDLPETIELKHFSENGDGTNNKHFLLNNDSYIWDVLANCGDADFVEDDKWTVFDREFLNFTVTSETLGVYKVSICITADGYLQTNVFDYQYLFRIGSDSAQKIIKYAKENSAEVDFEPYQNEIIGRITEITDEYIVVDDSDICKNFADGITYKILLNDLRIIRYVEKAIIKEGDTVQITYESEIKSGNIIDSAISVSQAIIFGEDVMLPE